MLKQNKMATSCISKNIQNITDESSRKKLSLPKGSQTFDLAPKQRLKILKIVSEHHLEDETSDDEEEPEFDQSQYKIPCSNGGRESHIRVFKKVNKAIKKKSELKSELFVSKICRNALENTLSLN